MSHAIRPIQTRSSSAPTSRHDGAARSDTPTENTGSTRLAPSLWLNLTVSPRTKPISMGRNLRSRVHAIRLGDTLSGPPTLRTLELKRSIAQGLLRIGRKK